MDLSSEKIRYLNAKIDEVRNPLAPREQRLAKLNGCCEACGYNKALDIHHDIPTGKQHLLCPNCHALITRKITTLAELLNKTIG